MTSLDALRLRSRVALEDEALTAAVRHATDTMVAGRARSLADLDNADALRDAARDVRTRAVARLPQLLDRWATNLEAGGGTVHWASDAQEAVAAVLGVLGRADRVRVAKGKSMASEEIHLNPALERAGHEVIETDLGEFILQLAHETPSHLIVPAIHRNRIDVAALFTDDAGRPVPPEVEAEAAYARERLRAAFLEADAGITGVNFAVAETGSIALVENEGNGRMCTSLPDIHIAIMGMERIVESWDDLDLMLALLARSATGQALTVYTNILTGVRQPNEVDGPSELHVVVLDNGRNALLGTEFSEALNCIRCGACLNVCPVYRQIGGHAYDSVYSGPIGAVLTPLLRPDDPGARALSEASSLCGACWDACPVRIPLHDQLLALRRRDARTDAGRWRALGFRVWSWLWSRRTGFALSAALTRVGLRLAPRRFAGAGWAGGWTRGRALPRPPGPSLRRRLRQDRQ